MISNMQATPLFRRRLVFAEDAFAEIVIWHVKRPGEPSGHAYRYRLACVVAGKCVLRYDNEREKGDRRPASGGEVGYRFSTPDRLMRDFEADIARWNREHGRS